MLEPIVYLLYPLAYARAYRLSIIPSRSSASLWISSSSTKWLITLRSWMDHSTAKVNDGIASTFCLVPLVERVVSLAPLSTFSYAYAPYWFLQLLLNLGSTIIKLPYVLCYVFPFDLSVHSCEPGTWGRCSSSFPFFSHAILSWLKSLLLVGYLKSLLLVVGYLKSLYS